MTVIGALGVLWLAQAMLAARLGAGPEDPEDEEGVRSAAHEAEARPSKPGRSLLLLAVPVVLGTLIPAAPLTAEAINNRGLRNAAPLQVGGGSAPVQFALAPEERTILDWLREFQRAEAPASFEGQPVDVLGFVYHEPRLPEDEFMLARFTLICCVADASAVAVQVDWPAASTLPSDQWVQVRGTMAVGEWEGVPMPRVMAETVEPIDPPEQPYLYP
jgi:uncharacterized repeat protein (TIGR03943 family)